MLLPLALQRQRLQRWLFDLGQPANLQLWMPVGESIRKHDKPACSYCGGCSRPDLANFLNNPGGAKQALRRVVLVAKAVRFA